VGVQTSEKLQSITEELRRAQGLLTTQADFDPRILSEFRDALNRVRTAAWVMQQYVEHQMQEQDPRRVFSLLAGERIRAGYQICKLISEDLHNDEVKIQKGQLLELNDAVEELAQELDKAVREL
jgi:hypothetical protein